MAADVHSTLELYRALRTTDPLRYAAQGWVESRFEADSVSPRGAAGLAQFMPSTWAWAIAMGWVPRDAQPTDPAAAVLAQFRYMQFLEGLLGSWRKALAGYNWGQGNVTRALHDHGVDWEQFIPRETFSYIQQCLAVHDWLRAIAS